MFESLCNTVNPHYQLCNIFFEWALKFLLASHKNHLVLCKNTLIFSFLDKLHDVATSPNSPRIYFAKTANLNDQFHIFL